MEDNVGAYYISDGEIKPEAEFESIDTVNKRIVYEVIRAIDGVPLFLEDHYRRMTGSFEAIGVHLGLRGDVLKGYIDKLLKANGFRNCNVKVVAFEDKSRLRAVLYVSKSYYPTETEADNGIRAGLLRIMRNDPNAKIINEQYKQKVSERIREGSFFEVLLVNDEGRITEGSKSNVFFIKGNRVYTAPGSSVLKGVTRKHVFEACSMAGFNVVEEFISENELSKIDGAFLSGTSIKVLPIASIEDFKNSSIKYSPDLPAVRAVRNEYDRLVKKYIEENVNIW